MSLDILICPLDGLPLKQQDGQWCCPDGHSFDIARQGYVNLLPVQFKKSRQPGDSKEMIAARSAFLNSGVYQPIAEALLKTVQPLLADQKNSHILDAGCGEGYYLTHLLEHWPSTAQWLGLDISKWAIQAATKRSKTPSWIVGSNRSLPVKAHSLDMIICAFGFADYAAFKKALKPGGWVVLVDSDTEHLIELRRIIYPEVRHSPPPSISAAEALGFKQCAQDSVRYQTPVLDRQQLQQLLQMTPHLYRASQEGKQAAQALDQLQLSIDVALRVLKAP